MKNLGLLLVALLASAGGLSAQVSVEVTMDRDQFLPGESVPVSVRVINHSGQTLHLGREADWLTFSVEARDGFIVFKSGEVPVVQEFELESSKVATKHSDLAPYFNLSRAGRYTVTATVNIRDWGQQLPSTPKNFEVVRGVKLWEQEFGVPQASATNHDQPEARKYVLQRTSSSKQSQLYLRVSDAAESKIFRVFPIGPVLSFSQLEPMLDKLSNLHLIYQTGARTFTYSMVNPDGEVLLRQTYDYADTRPRLKVDESGAIAVVGGVRHVAANDLPPARTLISSDDAKAPKP